MKFISSIGVCDAWTQQGLSLAVVPDLFSRNCQRRHSSLGYLNPAQFEVTVLAA